MASKDLRTNRQIRISPVRLIGADGEQVGIVPTTEALQRAQDAGLDLVEVSPTARPPVCRILDYGKYKYELAKKDKVAKKKQHSFQLKEMRFRPKIDQHDFEFKTKHVRTFLEAGSKVKAFVMFRGREMAYTDHGRKLLKRVAETLDDIATVEMNPKLDGRHMTMVLAPRPEIMKSLKKAEEERDRQKAEERAKTDPANIAKEKAAAEANEPKSEETKSDAG